MPIHTLLVVALLPSPAPTSATPLEPPASSIVLFASPDHDVAAEEGLFLANEPEPGAYKMHYAVRTYGVSAQHVTAGGWRLGGEVAAVEARFERGWARDDQLEALPVEGVDARTIVASAQLGYQFERIAVDGTVTAHGVDEAPTGGVRLSWGDLWQGPPGLIQDWWEVALGTHASLGSLSRVQVAYGVRRGPHSLRAGVEVSGTLVPDSRVCPGCDGLLPTTSPASFVEASPTFGPVRTHLRWVIDDASYVVLAVGAAL